MFKKKEKKKKLTREQKAELKARKKRLESRRNNFEGQDGFFSKNGYVEFDGYIHVLEKEIKSHEDVNRDENGYYLALFDVLIQYGTNNPAEIGWLNNLIPSQPLKNGDIYFAFREKKVDRDTENDLFSKKLHRRLNSTANQQTDNKDTDVKEHSKRQTQIVDMQLAIELAGAEEEIVDSDLTLIVKAKTVDKLEATIEELKENYNNDEVDGVILVRKISNQLKELTNLFHFVSADAWHNSDMETVDASRLFYPSSGFSDKYGTNVGDDVSSYLVNNPSLIDFSDVRNAVIMTGHIRGMFSIGGLEQPRLFDNFGSAWAHVIADDNYIVNGTRTHHILLVPFEYRASDNLVFDMSKYSINALETYGTEETVAEDANNNFSKVTEIIMMLLEEDHPNPAIKAMLRERLVSWITNRANGTGMYTTDPINNPTQARRILATTNHANYPTLQDFIIELQGMLQESESQSEGSFEKSKMLLDSVRTASRLYPSVFSKPTDIPDSFKMEDRNIYYDLSHISNNPNVNGAIFLNTLAYVTYRAKPGDMIVVHGIDKVKVNPRILTQYRDKMDRNNIGLITTFEDAENDEMNVDTLKSFVGALSTQDLVVLGGITDKSAKQIDSSWGHHELPKIVTNTLQNQRDNIFYVYRTKDYQSAIVNAHLIL